MEKRTPGARFVEGRARVGLGAGIAGPPSSKNHSSGWTTSLGEDQRSRKAAISTFSLRYETRRTSDSGISTMKRPLLVCAMVGAFSVSEEAPDATLVPGASWRKFPHLRRSADSRRSQVPSPCLSKCAGRPSRGAPSTIIDAIFRRPRRSTKCRAPSISPIAKNLARTPRPPQKHSIPDKLRHPYPPAAISLTKFHI